MASHPKVRANVEFLTIDPAFHEGPYEKMVQFTPSAGDYAQEHFTLRYDWRKPPSVVVTLHGDISVVSDALRRGKGKPGYFASFIINERNETSYYGRDAYKHLGWHTGEAVIVKVAAIISPAELFDDDTPLANSIARLLIDYKIYDRMEADYRDDHPIPKEKFKGEIGEKMTVSVRHLTDFEGVYTSYYDFLRYDEERGDFHVARESINGTFGTIVELIGTPEDILDQIMLGSGEELYSIAIDMKGGPEIRDLGLYINEVMGNGTEKLKISAAVFLYFDDLLMEESLLATRVKNILNRRWVVDLAAQEDEDRRADL